MKEGVGTHNIYNRLKCYKLKLLGKLVVYHLSFSFSFSFFQTSNYLLSKNQ